jgi:hypothetical protein
LLNGYIINENNERQDLYTVWDVPEFLKANKQEIDYFKILQQSGISQREQQWP